MFFHLSSKIRYDPFHWISISQDTLSTIFSSCLMLYIVRTLRVFFSFLSYSQLLVDRRIILYATTVPGLSLAEDLRRTKLLLYSSPKITDVGKSKKKNLPAEPAHGLVRVFQLVLIRKRTKFRRIWVNPFKAPEPFPILNPSNFVPKNGVLGVKGLRSPVTPKKFQPQKNVLRTSVS